MDKRIEDTFLEIIKEFSSTWDFKKFALRSNGLSLNFNTVKTFTENIHLSVKEKKLEILGLWRERNRNIATPQKLKDILAQYNQLEQQLVLPKAERLEDVFYEVTERFTIGDFRKFARIGNGLSLDENKVSDIAADYKDSVEEVKFQILWAWKVRLPHTQDAEIIRSIKQKVEQFHQLDHDQDAQNDHVVEEGAVARLDSEPLNIVNSFTEEQTIREKTELDQILIPAVNKVKLTGDAENKSAERLEDVFYKVIKRIPIRDFRKFARSGNGLSLDKNKVSNIAADYKDSIEEFKFQILWAWKVRLPHTQDAEIIRSIKQIVEQYHQLDQGSVARLDSEPSEEKLKLDKSEKFLKIVNSFTKGQVESVMKTIREKTNLDEILLPAVNKVKLTGDTENKSVIGTDLEATDISKLHNGKSVNHVMLLGNTGCGKTTFAHFYAKSAWEDKLDSLKNIKMVYLVDVSRLQADSKSTVFDLLFVQQLGAKLPSHLHEVGKNWLAENSSCVLLIIDGLDQAQKAFESECRYPYIAQDIHAKTNVIIANLLSGHIYPEMKILSTTRWSVYGKLHPDQRPGVTFALRGFDKISLDRLKNTMISRDKVTFIDALQEKSSTLISNPMFFSYLAKVLNSSEDLNLDTVTVSYLMVSVLRHFSGSAHKVNEKQLEDLMKLAFHGMKENRFIFSGNYIKDLNLKMSDMKGLVIKDADDKFLENVADDGDMRVRFSHQSLQEILGALHACCFEIGEFKSFVDEYYEKPEMEVVLNYIFGTILNKSTSVIAKKFIPEFLDAKREYLMGYLNKKLEKNVISDAHIAVILHECGSDVINRFGSKIQEISMEQKLLPLEEELAVMAVAERIPNISFKMWSIIVRQSTYRMLLNVISNAQHVYVAHLTLYKRNLNSGKLRLLIEAIKKRNNTTFYHFAIVSDRSMEDSAYCHVIEVVHHTNVRWLGLLDCDLDDRKIDKCLAAAMQNEIKLIGFLIDRNTKLDSEAFKKLASFLKHTKVQILGTTYCAQTANQLSAFYSSLKDENVSLVGFGLAKNSSKSITENELSMLHQLSQTCSYFIGYNGPMLTDSQVMHLEDEYKKASLDTKMMVFNGQEGFLLVNFVSDFITKLILILEDIVESYRGAFPEYKEKIDFEDIEKSYDHVVELFSHFANTFFNHGSFLKVVNNDEFQKILFPLLQIQCTAMKLNDQSQKEERTFHEDELD